eukprot:5414943-Amphidinium_carterae.1
MAMVRLPASEFVPEVEEPAELAVLPAAPFVVRPHQRVVESVAAFVWQKMLNCESLQSLAWSRTA